MKPPTSKLMIFGQLTCLLMAAWPTVTTFQAGKLLNALAGAIATAGILLWVAVEWTRDSLAATEIRAEEGGVALAGSRAQRIMLLGVQLCGTVAMVLIGYLQYTGRISWIPADGHYGRHGRTNAAVMPVVLPILGLLCLPFVFVILDKLASLEEPYDIRVQPDGVLLSYSEKKQRFLHWEDIADLPGGFYNPRGGFVPKVRFILAGGGRALDAPLVAVTDGCVPVNQLIHLYWSRPDLRGELTDGTALRRFRDRDFDAPAAAAVPPADRHAA